MKTSIIIIAGFLFLSGCSQNSDEKTFESRKEIRKQQIITETIGSGGEHLEGAAQVDSMSDKGSWSMKSSAKDYNYKDETTFNYNKK